MFNFQSIGQTYLYLNSITCSPNPITSGQYITVTVNVQNYGSSAYYDFEADFDDSYGSYLEIIQKQCSQYIVSGGSATITFNSIYPISYSPGTYNIYIKGSYSSCSGCGTSTTCYTNVYSFGATNPLSIAISTSCTGWAVTPNSQSVPSSGGSYSATVSTAVGGCSYNTSIPYPDNTWLTFISPGIGGVFNYSVASNSSSSSRTGHIYVNDVSDGVSSICTLSVNQAAAPSTYVTASFSSSPGCPGSNTYFYDNSYGSPSPNMWSWDFGDGYSSTSENPTHIYSSSGNHTVSLTVHNSAGNSNTTSNVITIPFANTTANFTEAVGYSGSPTSFTDVSSYSCSSYGTFWNWDFGDGYTSTSRNPSHIYSTPGSKTVSLTACNNFGNCNSTFQTISVDAPPSTITISSIGAIAPWQRAGENFTVSFSAVSSDASEWQIIAHDPSGINSDQNSSFSSSGSTINYTFNFPKPTSSIQYFARNMSGATSSVLPSPNQTEIIDSVWNNKNVVYYNDPSESLKIPLKYIQGTTSVTYSFERSAGTSNYEDIIIPGSIAGGDNEFLIFINSTLKFLNPGVFTCSITYNGAGYTETCQFDLTKIGNYGGFSATNDTLVILIAGNRNNIDSEFQNLILSTDQSLAWSVSENFRTPYFSIVDPSISAKYNTWYIGQSNENYIKNNAYDIGIGIANILDILSNSSVPVNHIVLFAHSFGGIQVRTLLSGMGRQLNGTANIPFSDYNIYPEIEKVIFIGSPHEGIATGSWEISDGNAADEMTLGSHFLDSLNFINGYESSLIPDGISFLNVTGYDALANTPYGSQSDGLVSVWSSEYPVLCNSSGFFCPKQLFIFDNVYRTPDNLWALHTMLHHSDVLKSTKDVCDENSSNIAKIFNFIRDENIENCFNYTFNSDYIQVFGSILPGSKIYLKQLSDTSYSFIGTTDENSILKTSLIQNISVGDSIEIIASGYVNLVVVVDSNIIKNKKLIASMVKSTIPTNKVKYASLISLESGNLISSNSISIKATGQNVIAYQINSPFNQDTNYVSLSLIDSIFTAVLDTGSNLISVRFIGISDTVTLSKSIIYLPDSIMDHSTYNVILSSDSSGLGSKIYVNDIFVKNINYLNDSIRLLAGENMLQFIKFGYIDSTIKVNSESTIDLSLQLVPFSYSSTYDSSMIDFTSGNKLQYIKNVTVMDTALVNIISIKQFDTNLSVLGLRTNCREFELRHLSSAWSNIKFSAILDQIQNLSETRHFLMMICNDTGFAKIAIDSTSGAPKYDSTTQKLSYDFVNFNNGTLSKEALILAEKQPAVIRSTSLTINENDSLIIPIATFIGDPDSLRDISCHLADTTPLGLTVLVIGNNLCVFANHCFSGSTSFDLVAIHDWLTITNSVSVNVIPMPQSTIISVGDTIFCSGSSVSLEATSGTEYQWLKNNMVIAGATDSEITIDSAGLYSAIVFVQGCADSSNKIQITVNPTPTLLTTPLLSICNNSIYSFVPISSVAGAVFEWSRNPNIGIANSAASGTDSINEILIDTTAFPATVQYVTTLTSSACIQIDTIDIEVVLPANAGTLSGNTSICQLTTSTFSDFITGGVFSSGRGLTSISSDSVTGVSVGIDSIVYTVTNACGPVSTSILVTVNPLPFAGTILGDSTLCVGDELLLMDDILLGNWYTSNTNAFISASGVAVGVSPGSVTIEYTVTNECGVDTSRKNITVSPLPNSGVIFGLSEVCTGSTIFLESSASGGTWSCGSTSICSIDTTGVVTGVSAGTVSIKYRVSNSCGTDSTFFLITDNPLPEISPISGSSSACVDAPIFLTDSVTGGSWSSTNYHSIISGGMVYGLTQGVDTITYSATNMCGTVKTEKVVTINPLPSAGTITGMSNVCVGQTITLTDTITGGIWTSSNTSVANTNGIISGTSVGLDTIEYSVENYCGESQTSMIINVNPLPYAGVITGFDTVCIDKTIHLFDSILGGTWSSTDNNSFISSTGAVHGFTVGSDTIIYSVSNSCGIDVTKFVVTISTVLTPEVFGATAVCVGDFDTLGCSYSGGLWSVENAHALMLPEGIVAGFSGGLDTVIYEITNLCGTGMAIFPLIIYDKQQCDSIDFLNEIHVESPQGLKVYPNPTLGSFTIQISTTLCVNSDIRIADVLGRIIVRKSVIPTVGVSFYSFSNFPSGVYLVTYENEMGKTVLKLIVE